MNFDIGDPFDKLTFPMLTPILFRTLSYPFTAMNAFHHSHPSKPLRATLRSPTAPPNIVALARLCGTFRVVVPDRPCHRETLLCCPSEM